MDSVKSIFFRNPPSFTGRLTVHGIGIDVSKAPGLVHRPTGSGDYLFVFFSEPAQLSQGGRTAPVPADSLILWAPGQHQCYGDPLQAHTLSWIHCDGQRVRDIISDLNLPLDRVLAPVDGTPFRTTLTAIYAELTGHAEPDEVIVGNHLENWMRGLKRQLGQHQQAKWAPRALLELKHQLDITFARPHRLGELAERMGLSVPHLSALFKRHFGISPIHYLIRLRMRHAVHLLRDRNLSVSEVARQVGYEDLYHFSKLFKKHHGISPRPMRRSLLS